MDQRTKIMLKAIDEFEAHFNLNNRAEKPVITKNGTETKNCVYVDERNNFCGHSFFLTDEARNYASKQERIRVINSNDVIDACMNLGIIPIHRGEYSVLDDSTEFWAELQEIHDTASNFTEEGISDLGKKELNTLRQRVENEDYL